MMRDAWWRDAVWLGAALAIGHFVICPIQHWPAQIRRPAVRDRWPAIALAVALGGLLRWTLPALLVVALASPAVAQISDPTAPNVVTGTLQPQAPGLGDPMAAAMLATAQAQLNDPADLSGWNQHIFADMWSATTVLLDQSTATISRGLAGVIAPILRDASLLYLTAVLLMGLFKAPPGNALGLVIGQSLRYALVAMLVGNPGLFEAHVARPLLIDIPNEFNAAIAGGADLTGGGWADDLWAGRAFPAGLVVYKHLPSLSIKGTLLCLCVFIYWALALGMIGWAFLVQLGCHTILAMMVAVSPLALGAASTPATRQWFTGWLNVVAGTILAQTMVTALMALMVAVLTKELTRIAGAPAASNEVGQLAGLMGVGVQLLIAAIVTKQIPSIAAAWTSSAWLGVNAFPAQAWQGAQGLATMASAGWSRLQSGGAGGRSGGGSGSPQPAYPGGVGSPALAFSGPARGGHYQPLVPLLLIAVSAVVA